MANKQLTAKVRLNVTQAERAIASLEKRIKALNTAANKVNSNNRVNNQLQKQVNKQERIRKEAEKTNSAWQRGKQVLSNITAKTREWLHKQTQVHNKLRASNSLFGGIWGKLRGIAATYLGIMGLRGVVNATDSLTGAQNRLNYVSADNLGDAGYKADGSYSTATLNATQDALDKMYVSSQRVRTSYQDMLKNVSKTMALAGDAFDNNIDNAIRFQEIMAESYAVGGASAQEMSSSMYQLTQALGSGILQGDELRSVREGAPLAYKAIEKFAQGVLNTEESLKNLASEGKITSEMVVAAILSEGEALDKAFNQSAMTFGQVFDQIKNSALYAFQPVMEMLQDMLESAVDNGMIQKFEKFFTTVSKIIMIAFTVISNGISWIADNWNWLKHIVIGVFILWATYAVITAAANIAAAVATAIAWVLSLSKITIAIFVVIAAVGALIYIFYLWKTGSIDTCNAIVAALMVVAAALFIVGLMTGNIAVIIAAVVAIAIALIIRFAETVFGIGWVIFTFIGNLIQNILNIIVTIILIIFALFANTVALIINTLMGLLNVIGAFCTNAGILFSNLWNGAKAAFWSFIADCLEGLKKLETPINAVAKALGKEGFTISGLVETVRGKASAAESNIRSYVDYGDAWDTGIGTFDYVDINSLVDSGLNTFGTGLEDWSASAAYNDGAAVGAAFKNWLNDAGSKFQSNPADGLQGDMLDRIGNKLGLDFSNMGKFPTEGVSTGSPDLDKLLGGVGNIDDNTGDIADSMDLTKEELEYLRRLANQGWTNKFTTASINVEMTNNNNVNNDYDLKSLAIGLRDLVVEEMYAVADGVYA